MRSSSSRTSDSDANNSSSRPIYGDLAVEDALAPPRRDTFRGNLGASLSMVTSDVNNLPSGSFPPANGARNADASIGHHYARDTFRENLEGKRTVNSNELKRFI
jgi:hypothetical protein